MFSSNQPQISVPEPPRRLQAATARLAIALGRFPLFGIVCLGFALRCYWWLKYPDINSPDAIVYLKEADILFATGTMKTIVYMPLYPILPSPAQTESSFFRSSFRRSRSILDTGSPPISGAGSLPGWSPPP